MKPNVYNTSNATSTCFIDCHNIHNVDCLRFNYFDLPNDPIESRVQNATKRGAD